MCSVIFSRSKIGTSSSIERQKAASEFSTVPPWQRQLWPSGEGPRPNSEFIVSTSISTATRIAAFQ
jgi:hypothetical protein